jgi:prophage antirepressor-like protein
MNVENQNPPSFIEVLDYQDQPVRIFGTRDEPLFVAADVCRILELTNPTEALRGLDDDEKMTLSNAEGHSGQRGGAQSYNCLTESGLYALIFTSRKPQAKEFRRWVTHEVLPTLRKTGSYSKPKVEDAKPKEPLKIEDAEPRMTVPAFCNNIGFNLKALVLFGQRVKSLANAIGTSYTTSLDPWFGESRTYPRALLNAALREWGADVRALSKRRSRA